LERWRVVLSASHRVRRRSSSAHRRAVLLSEDGHHRNGDGVLGRPALESGVSDAGRQIRTGQVQSQGIDEAGFRALLCNEIGVMFDCDQRLAIDVQRVQRFDEHELNPRPVDGDGNFNGAFGFDPGWRRNGNRSSAFYRWPLLFNFMGLDASDIAGRQRLLVATTAFRNEPFLVRLIAMQKQDNPACQADRFGLLKVARRIRSFRREKRGVAAIEFAMIAPFMIALWLGSLELSQGVSVDRKVSHAASALGRSRYPADQPDR
jgi:Flp pilus assembly pilin Flp